MTVLAIKISYMKQMPECCEYCLHMECKPHPYKGWTDICGLCSQHMDDDAPEEWHYDGNGRPKACPLVEITDSQDGGANNA